MVGGAGSRVFWADGDKSALGADTLGDGGLLAALLTELLFLLPPARRRVFDAVCAQRFHGVEARWWSVDGWSGMRHLWVTGGAFVWGHCRRIEKGRLKEEERGEEKEEGENE